MRFLSTFFAIALMLSGTMATNAQTTLSTSDVPYTISYQGLLTSTDGTPFADGLYDLTITLYGDEHGTQRIWQNTYITEVKRGIFNLYLGGGATPLPAPGALNTSLWIGTSVDGAPEMRPLTPLSASPYALNVPDKSITAAKVDMDYISELRIDGQKVSGKGSVLDLRSSDGVALNYDETTQSVTIGRATPVRSGTDGEKGAGVLANPDQVWSAGGDGWDIGSNTTYTPANGDWLGTTNSVDLEFRVENELAMLYQTTGGGSVPNIIGGQGHIITPSSTAASIIAGGTNSAIANGNNNVIGGGNSNLIDNGDYNTVAGGSENSIANGNNYASIGGGERNSVEGEYGTIGGGSRNTVHANYGTIPGGDNLVTNASYAQTAVGFTNAPRGSMPDQPTGTQIAASNDPLFMVGNGDAGAHATSNAFEVSYNGHTTVYGKLGNSPGTGTGPAPIVGATYADNIVYAWGEIDATGAVVSDFGLIQPVGHIGGSGFYAVQVHFSDPQGNPVNLTNMAVTATINADVCGMITVRRTLNPNVFNVYTWDPDCRPRDHAFTFHVTGRR